jgi:membrane protein required for beta-lactamase induction
MPLRGQWLRGMQRQHAVQTLVKCRPRHAIGHVINPLGGLFALPEQVQNFLHGRCSSLLQLQLCNPIFICIKLDVNRLQTNVSVAKAYPGSFKF